LSGPSRRLPVIRGTSAERDSACPERGVGARYVLHQEEAEPMATQTQGRWLQDVLSRGELIRHGAGMTGGLLALNAVGPFAGRANAQGSHR
jgi:hypothetical protein